MKFSLIRALKTAQAKLKSQQQVNAQLEEQRKKEEVRCTLRYEKYELIFFSFFLLLIGYVCIIVCHFFLGGTCWLPQKLFLVFSNLFIYYNVASFLLPLINSPDLSSFNALSLLYSVNVFLFFSYKIR